MHAKYEVSISYSSKVIAKVKVDNRQTDRPTNKQTNIETGQKQYAPDHSIRGHKNLQSPSKTKHSMFVKHVPSLWAYFLEVTRGATVSRCAPVISFCCKGLFISMKTKSNAGGKMIRDMGK